MLLTFALCATLVFAQSMKPSTKSVQTAKDFKSVAMVTRTDANSSLFTKNVDTAGFVSFTDGTVSQNLWTGANWHTGTVVAADGTGNAHNKSTNSSFWQKWTYSQVSTDMPNTYTTLYSQYFGGRAETWEAYIKTYADSTMASTETGFMMISLFEYGNSGNYNAYIEFDNLDFSNATVVDAQFYQYYRKFYDFCYIDYKIGNGAWTPVEINVSGLDVEVNGQIRGISTFTLPLAIAGQNDVSFRIRAYSPNNHRSNIFGYYWIIDDVRFLGMNGDDADRFLPYAQEWVEGAYSLVPQNLDLNPAWYTSVVNNGGVAQNAMKVELLHRGADTNENFVPFVSNEFNTTLAAGDTANRYCDKYGWLPIEDSMVYRGWLGYASGIQSGNGSSLPTSVLGDNYVRAEVSGNATADTAKYRSVFYTVGGQVSQLNNGYRWGHDNGLLLYNPYNYWFYGWILINGNYYVTDDPETGEGEETDWNTVDYGATVRYTTGNNVPEGWKILGVEIVASPVEGYYAQTAIKPMLIWDEYEDDGVRFHQFDLGVSYHNITESELNEDFTFGVRELGNYNSIYIPFPNQPDLDTNTSYRIGYMMAQTGNFLPARNGMTAYIANEGDETYTYTSDDPSLKKYANQFAPNTYQNLVFDGLNADRGTLWASNQYSPMIRMIVGPEVQYTFYDIYFNNSYDTIYGYVTYNDKLVGYYQADTAKQVEGGTGVLRLIPTDDGMVTGFILDGDTIDLNSASREDEDAQFYYDEETHIYTYRLENVTANHTVEVIFNEYVGIDPVAASVKMSLMPNPASSQVTLNVEGVEGNINCAIIDMSGRVVSNTTINAQNSNVIDLSNMSKGAYFVRITNNNFTKVEKLIVR